jgi:hypothetical protein
MTLKMISNIPIRIVSTKFEALKAFETFIEGANEVQMR